MSGFIRFSFFSFSPNPQAETALMYDAVHLFAKALHDLDTSQQIDIHPLSCDTQDTWPHGYSLINYMKIVCIVPPPVFAFRTYLSVGLTDAG
ncbi:hypothetical protein RP20_CCG026076 [Aedes albopictus]|nr:hypothetical protein RP20_CCG026076 [Aedes albopictus]